MIMMDIVTGANQGIGKAIAGAIAEARLTPPRREAHNGV